MTLQNVQWFIFVFKIGHIDHFVLSKLKKYTLCLKCLITNLKPIWIPILNWWTLRNTTASWLSLDYKLFFYDNISCHAKVTLGCSLRKVKVLSIVFMLPYVCAHIWPGFIKLPLDLKVGEWTCIKYLGLL